MRSILKWMMIPSLLVFLSSCSEKKEEKTKSDLTVKVNDVRSRLDDKQEEFPFIAKPFRSSELSFRVSGPILQFDVIAGNFYRKGEVIARIDPRDFTIRKERAEAVYTQAKAEFERVKALFEKNNLSASAFEKARAEYTTARTSYETASNELNDTGLIAPFDGFVGEVFMEKYQDVKATQPVLTFVELDRLRIEAYVPQHMVGLLRDQKNVEVVFDAFPEDRFSAGLLDISKNTTRNNLSYLLTSELKNPDHRILAGMSGKLVFNQVVAADEPLTVIPQKALCHRPSLGEYVWVINPETSCAEVRRVKTGRMISGGMIEIHDGVISGEKIAVSGLRFLSQQKKVNVIDEGIASTASSSAKRIMP
ncbi:MAG: efflux RND transporter periplasmic adaptor subunit [Bacteroidales bacterium]